MSLTNTDLRDIRRINREENQALENDIKEIYQMLASMQRGMISDERFQKLSVEGKLLTLNTELLYVAKQARVELHR